MRADRFARAAVERLDETAAAMERKWGIGRLERLVDPALAARFDIQRDKLNDALRSDRPDAIATQAAAMERAWKALDAAALAAGAQTLSVNAWEAITPSGEVIAIVRTPEEAALLAKDRKGAVYTVAEVAVAIDAFGDQVRAVKAAFPGAGVTAVRSCDPGIGSEPQNFGCGGRTRAAPRRTLVKGAKAAGDLLFAPDKTIGIQPRGTDADDFFNDEIPF